MMAEWGGWAPMSRNMCTCTAPWHPSASKKASALLPYAGFTLSSSCTSSSSSSFWAFLQYFCRLGIAESPGAQQTQTGALSVPGTCSVVWRVGVCVWGGGVQIHTDSAVLMDPRLLYIVCGLFIHPV